ncbi:MAG: hypothetical protein J6W81_03440 [Lentisphaeria bacterium]|nr:hypothetical protein [Lentisphaeria bacterium]
MDAPELLWEKLTASFRAYAESFIPQDEDAVRPYQLKVDHTFDVCSIMDQILSDEKITPEQHFIYRLCALFHDVSRFEQLRDHHTFRDDRSFDHGERSAEIFLKQFSVPELSSHSLALTMEAIRYHNKAELPEDLSAELRPYAEALRDADKISILKVLLHHFSHPLLSEQEIVNLGTVDTPGFTEELVHTALSGRHILHKDMKNVNDFKIAVFAWCTDFNLPGSARLVLTEKFYDQLRQYLPESPLLDQLHRYCIDTLQKTARKGRN